MTPLALALLAGVLGAIQPELNAGLGDRLGNGFLAAGVNFAGAVTLAWTAVALRPVTRANLRRIRRWPVPRWTLTAGLGGALFVTASIVSVDRIGITAFSVAVIAGQLAAGAGIDRLGLGAGPARALTSRRLGALALAVAAVALARAGGPAGEVVVGLLVLAVLAGVGMAFQSAFNGRIAAATDDPFAATAVNVVVGSVAVGVAATVATLVAAERDGGGAWPSEWWLYLGGACGFTIVVCLAVATRALGTLATGVVTTAAQLGAALVIDRVVDGRSPSAGLALGCALIAVAVALVRSGTPATS